MKGCLLHLIHSVISRFWVRPLEDRIIPFLEKKPGENSKRLLGWASWMANAGRVIVNETRPHMIQWVGMDWSVTYVGNGENVELLRSLLFPTSSEEAGSSRISLWQVPALIRKHSAEGELVVCELNKIISLFPGKKMEVSFTTPQAIQQVIEGFDRPLVELMAGFHQQTRQRIRRLEEQGYSYIASHSEADFELFYHRMYLPYTEERHSGRSIILWDYDSLHRLFSSGVLILVKKDGEPVAGGLRNLEGDTCTAIIMGVLDGRYDLVKQGCIVALTWYGMLWAHQQGARQYNMGSSFSLTSIGHFNFKRQWGARVTHPDKSIRQKWSFFGNNLPFQLRDHLNGLGLITEAAGKYYQVLLSGPVEQIDETKLADQLYHVSKSGLAGIERISPDGERRVIPVEAFRQDHSGKRYLVYHQFSSF